MVHAVPECDTAVPRPLPAICAPAEAATQAMTNPSTICRSIAALLALQRDAKLCRRLRLHVLELHARMELFQHQSLARLDFEHAQVGDDHVHHALAGDWQRAAL